jgi:hypothetical protein
MEKAQPLSARTLEPGREQTRKDDQDCNFIPSLTRNIPIMPGNIMQGRPGGGCFGNSLPYSRPLPRKRLNRRPQAFPTLLAAIAHIAANTMARQTISQSNAMPWYCLLGGKTFRLKDARIATQEYFEVGF